MTTAVPGAEPAAVGRGVASGACGTRPVRNGSGAGLGAGLLLALAALLAHPAHAQITVPTDWGAKPAAVGPGTSFRLLFITSTGIECTSTSIGTYNTHVQGRAATGANIGSYSSQFKAVASTSAIDARTNASGAVDAVIYWVNGAKVADNTADFYDGSWDSRAGRTQSGSAVANSERMWTGSNSNGTKHASDYLGSSDKCRFGSMSGSTPLSVNSNSIRSNMYRLFALSPVFQTTTTPAAITNLAAAGGVGSVTLSWSEPNDGGSAITRYQYRQSTDGNTWGGWVTIPGTGAGTTGHTVPELNGGTSYTFQVRAGNGVGDATESNSASAQARLPTMSIAAPASVAEGAGRVVFTVSLDAAYHLSATANWSTSGGTATAGTDYTMVSNATVTVPAGSTSARLTVTVAQDTVDERRETVTVSLSAPSNATLSSAASATGTITDDDLSTVSIAAIGTSVTEGSAAAFAVSRGITDDVPLTVNLGNSQLGDFLAGTPPGSVTIAGGAMSATVSIATDDDEVTEPSGSVTLTIREHPAYILGSDTSATVTIRDNDAQYTLSIGGGGDVNEGGSVSFTVTLSEASLSEQIAVQWGTEDGTAEAPGDFTPDGGTLTFAAGANGDALTRQVSVAVIDDSVHEAEETFRVVLSSATGTGATIGMDHAVATIRDNDVPQLSITGARANEDAGTIGFPVALSLTSAVQVMVDYQGSSGPGDTAAAGSDYTAATGTLTFQPGDRAKTIEISLIDDSTAGEADETFTVTLSSPSAAGTGSSTPTLASPASAKGTIVDDDGPPTLNLIGGGTVDEGAGGAGFAVTLSATASEPVTVRWDTADGTAQAPADYTAADGTLTFAAAAAGSALTQRFTVAISDDSLDEADETFTVTLSQAAGASATIGTSSATVTIGDNDEAPLQLTVLDTTCAESVDLCAVRVSLNKANPFEVNFRLRTQDGTAIGRTAAGADFARGEDFKHRANFEVDFPPTTDPNEIPSLRPTVRIAQDQIDEEDETFTYTVTLVGDANVEIADGVGVVTILDDDPPSSVKIADASAEEPDGTISFVVSLDHESGKHIGVAWETVDGTAVAGQDYQATSEVVNFAPGMIARTISVAVIDDLDREPEGENFQVTLSRAAGTDADDLDLGDQGDAVATGTINPSDLNHRPATGARE